MTVQLAPAAPSTPGPLKTRRRPHLLRSGGVAAVAFCVALGTPALSAEAATTFSRVSLTASVTGSSVTVATTVKASTATVASVFKVCVRSSTNSNLDFPARTNVTITTTGTSFTATKTFSPGSYSYFSCLLVGSQWYAVDAAKTFTVTSSPTTTATTSASTSTSMPTTSTRPGWAYSYGEDFTRSAPTGSFASVYGWNWSGYRGVHNDTSRNGSYQPDKVLSVANGYLDMKLGYDASTGLYNVAAPFPQPPANVNGGSPEYLGMRTSIRFKSTNSLPGYKVAWMLWPSTWNWNDGEIDFPENSLDSPIYGFAHEAGTGNPSNNSMWAKSAATFSDGWHVATTEWVPGVSIEFFLDGVSIGKTTSHVPTVPMHWTLQTETDLSGTAPSKSVSGDILVDWLTVESWKG